MYEQLKLWITDLNVYISSMNSYVVLAISIITSLVAWPILKYLVRLPFSGRKMSELGQVIINSLENDANSWFISKSDQGESTKAICTTKKVEPGKAEDEMQIYIAGKYAGDITHWRHKDDAAREEIAPSLRRYERRRILAAAKVIYDSLKAAEDTVTNSVRYQRISTVLSRKG